MTPNNSSNKIQSSDSYISFKERKPENANNIYFLNSSKKNSFQRIPDYTLSNFQYRKKPHYCQYNNFSIISKEDIFRRNEESKVLKRHFFLLNNKVIKGLTKQSEHMNYINNSINNMQKEKNFCFQEFEKNKKRSKSTKNSRI